MPTSVNAETTDFEDNVVTVEVDLGSEGPNPDLCEGFASMTVPGNTLPATLNRRVDGNSSPTMADLLAYFWGDYDWETNSAELYTDEDFQGQLNYLNNVVESPYYFDWNAVTVPENAAIADLVSIDYQPIEEEGMQTQYLQEDRNKDGSIDIADAPEFITETRRSYSTEWFTVSYDANDCMDSEDMAIVVVGRAPILRAADENDVFVEAELMWDENNWYNADIDNKAEAYLKVRTNLIGGLVSLPNSVAWGTISDFSDYAPWDVDAVAFGDEGSAQMRSMMNIYGASPTGIYQANYYYQLEVNDEEYFFDEFGFFGCYFFGGCL
jgi:hypothetical protein